LSFNHLLSTGFFSLFSSCHFFFDQGNIKSLADQEILRKTATSITPRYLKPRHVVLRSQAHSPRLVSTTFFYRRYLQFSAPGRAPSFHSPYFLGGSPPTNNMEPVVFDETPLADYLKGWFLSLHSFVPSAKNKILIYASSSQLAVRIQNQSGHPQAAPRRVTPRFATIIRPS
jgi:hypothetical protein